jgi:Spy/CpxP family protein refolding chaperone
MTLRMKTILTAGAVALALAATAPWLAGAAFAQTSAPKQDAPMRRGPGPGGPGGPMMGRGGPGFGLPLRELNLSEDQQAQLRKIRESRAAEFKQAGDKVFAAREAVRKLAEADSIDETAIRAKSTDVAAAEAEMTILNAKVRQESMQILTAEQQQKLKELQANRQGPMKRRGPRGQ